MKHHTDRDPAEAIPNHCVWCGEITRPVEGVFLKALYPSRTICVGCGRLQLHCSCVERKASA